MHPLMTDNAANDLSAYELARLERIKRNESRLRDLGLIHDKPKIKRSVVDDPVKKAVAKRERQKLPVATRSSKRLQGLTKDENIRHLKDEVLEVEDNSGKEDVVEGDVNYATMPQNPEELDDNEFQIYAKLRAWRLHRKNELEVEPYKICQNRTLCELIRRRRNNSAFASLMAGEANDMEQDLLTVWGIGPSKATQGGFGWEMIEVLDLDENCQLLELSRCSSTDGKGSISPQVKGTRLISPSTMKKAIMIVTFAALHGATAFTPNLYHNSFVSTSSEQRAHVSTSLQCICIHCARVTNCNAYHFVEEQHAQPHINKSPTWEPRNGSPTIQVHIRPDVNGKIQQEIGQMQNEHDNETRRAEEMSSNSQGGEEDVPLFGEKQYDLRGTTSYEYDVVECEDFVLSKDNWVLNMPEEIRIANPNFVPT